MARYTKNAGYGQQNFLVPTLGSGKLFIVGDSGTANISMLQEIWGVDPDGKARFFTTVDAAISQCTANAGDVILIMPGHAEAVTATSIALDVAGVSIIGLGNGLDRPTFTYGAAAATITVSAANCAWKNCHFIANFDNVASAFTLEDAKDLTIEGNTFDDNTAALHFLSIVVTSATDQEAEGLKVLGNRWNGLALAPNAFISILAATDRIQANDNVVYMDATNDVGHFITLAAKIVLEFECVGNKLIVVGAAGATVGIFLTGSGSTSKGYVEDNRIASLDTTSELIATTGTGLKFFNNTYTGTADKSGYVLPAIDAA